MKHILSNEGLRLLSRFLLRDPLLAFDFDGTLAPIVGNPSAAQMRPSTRRLLRHLSRQRPCAVISGRMREDTAQRLAGIPLVAVVGDHGAEWEGEVPDFRVSAQIRSWHERLTSELPSAGIWIEDKAFSITVHMARSVSTRDIRATLERLPTARIIGGKCVFNILPAGANGKGQALLRLMNSFHRDAALYIGDDETDEDIFCLTALDSDDILKLRVGQNRSSKATYYISSQEEIDRLLEACCDSHEHRAPENINA